MIDAVIRWSLNNRVLVVLASVVLLIWGTIRARDMAVDIFPDLTAPSVTVLTEAHGMAPEEVERLVTSPLEAALNGATGVRRVRSSTSVGISVVWVEFEWGVEVSRARQVVAEKVQLVAPSLPPELDSPVLAPVSSVMGEILFLGLWSETVPGTELRAFADWEVRRRLLAVPGVAQVVTMGGGVQQFEVRVRPADLAAHGATLDDVVRAVEASNENTSAGFYEAGGQEYLIYGLGRVESAEDIGAAVIRPDRVGSLRVSDVADVALGVGIQRGAAAVNGRPAVVLSVQKQPGVNTLELTRALESVLDDVELGLPEGARLERHLLRQADFIETGVQNVRHALRDGALLVVLIVGVFLLSGRATLITALAIPLSLVVAVLVLDAFGASLNTMTMGGMAIAVGALVDDAIIDVENVVRRMRQRLGAGDTAGTLRIVFDASREIRGSIVFATLIIVLVFVPVFFLEGVEGRMLAPLGLAYVVSLVASLAVAVTVTPVLCAILLPGSRAVRAAHETALVRRLRAAYDPLLARALNAWPVVLCLALAAVVAASAWMWQAGRTFLPEFNEGALTISVVTAPGTSLEQSSLVGQQVEAILLNHPEVAATARRTGRAELDEHAQAIHSSEIEVRLQMHDRTEAEFLAALRADLAGVGGANIVIGQPISHRIDHMISGTRANIAVKVFGPDLRELQRLAEQIRGQLEGTPGVVDLAVEDESNLPLATVVFDRAALARYGLTVRDVAETVETAFYGRAVSRVLIGPRALDLVVRYPDSAREDLQTIRQTMIPTPAGAWVPLEALAKVERDVGPNQISRENGQRKIVVMCNAAPGVALGALVDVLKERVRSGVDFPDGYHVEFGGQFEAAEAAAERLALLGVLVVAGILVLLQLALQSTRDALLVMLNLPLALIGGAIGVAAGGGVMSIASIIGFITLFGIAAHNGIMLVTHIRHLMTYEGVEDPREAVIRGASERLAPILMTALASGLGLAPVALAAGEPGSEIQAPMATVILFGLTSATALNMFVVPAAMLRFGSIRAGRVEAGPAAERV